MEEGKGANVVPKSSCADDPRLTNRRNANRGFRGLRVWRRAVDSRCYACSSAGQMRAESFEEFDKLHFEVENLLIALIESLQKKQQTGGEWLDNFAEKSQCDGDMHS